nr:hypothetical protein [uncultured Blautia sp.]
MEEDVRVQTTLDQMVTSHTSQFLKAAIPYLPAASRQVLSVYVKAAELQNTMQLFSHQGTEMQISSTPQEDPTEILNDIRRYCYGDTRKSLDQAVNMMAMLEMIKIMGQT